MLDLFWLLLLISGIGTAAWQGKPSLVTDSLTLTAQSSVEVIVGLGAVLVVWSGLARVAQEAGLTEAMAKWCRPFLKFLFPEIPAEHPALASIALNVSANLLGLGNAATPFGLQAMRDLETLNVEQGTATPAMCRLLALNTAGLTLVPSTVIAIRAASGSRDPGAIVVPALLSSLVGLAVALIADELFRRRHLRRERRR